MSVLYGRLSVVAGAALALCCSETVVVHSPRPPSAGVRVLEENLWPLEPSLTETTIEQKPDWLVDLYAVLGDARQDAFWKDYPDIVSGVYYDEVFINADDMLDRAGRIHVPESINNAYLVFEGSYADLSAHIRDVVAEGLIPVCLYEDCMLLGATRRPIDLKASLVISETPLTMEDLINSADKISMRELYDEFRFDKELKGLLSSYRSYSRGLLAVSEYLMQGDNGERFLGMARVRTYCIRLLHHYVNHWFIEENEQLIESTEYTPLPIVKHRLMDVINNPFIQRAAGMQDYDLSHIGRVVSLIPED